jgi:hypothetical protein
MINSNDLSWSDEPCKTANTQVKLLSIRRIIVKEGSVETGLIGIPGRLKISRAWIPGSITVLCMKCFER